ncbi:MAG: hypothetical protein FJ189_04485 [Gammaproteobacteria bacterium]|nr:hypothetical protein [Gammaproteobacteria bacterium]
MDPETRDFTLRYRRFMRMAEILARLAPERAQSMLARTLGRHASPYRMRADSMKAAMGAALALEPDALRLAWKAWRENHGLFAVAVFHYESLAKGWLHERIGVATPALLDELTTTGGLVLTYHCHHQNTLAALIGMHCGTMTALAARADITPSYPILGTYIDRINRDSERWFGTGHYLFNDNLRAVVRESRELLEQKKILLALCDNDWPTGPAIPLLGRWFRPPVGALTIARRLGVPMLAALMVPSAHGLVLHLHRLPAETELAEILAAYVAFLEMHVRANPACWQGWEWWNRLPTTPPSGSLLG